ncbi:DNA-directed RNA polymerase subunit beta [Paenibacillus sp. FA6]|uniref:DNA-directed RNA polymerase subunit beta n=1 Tax=Paenibacillus sp. FA6 TaxID=3413029 RepID=UPI003F65FA8C
MSKANEATKNTKTTKVAKPKTPTWRIVLRWLVPVFLLIGLMSGMIVGYVVFGKRSINEVFHWETWKHVLDLVFAPS